MPNRPPQRIDELQQAMRRTTGGLAYGRAMMAKYDDTCGWCGQAVMRGDIVAYLPNNKCVLCAGCASDEWGGADA